MTFRNVTLGGQLIHTETLTEVNQESVQSTSDITRHNAMISLGIPTKALVKVSYAQEKGTQDVSGDNKQIAVDNLLWTASGGDPALSTEYQRVRLYVSS